MANHTPNFNLEKPLPSEHYNVSVLNGNMDIIDSQLKTQSDKLTSYCDTTFYTTTLPETKKGITPFSVNGGGSLSVGGITIPGYSKGIIVGSANNSDATLYAIDTEGNIYTAYKNVSTWQNGQKIVKNGQYYIGIRGVETQVHPYFANVAEFVKYCRDLRTSEPSKFGRSYAPWTFHCEGITSGGFFGTSGFTAIAFFTSANYGWIHCFSDNANGGSVHICVNSNTAYLQVPTVTITNISLG